jgi:probable addiction module antidote protein
MKRTANYDEYVEKHLQNPRKLKAYAQAIFEEYENDHDTKAFLVGIYRLAQAQGGLGELAEKTSLNRQNLYKIFSGKSVPRFDTMSTILHGLGLQLNVSLYKK